MVRTPQSTRATKAQINEEGIIGQIRRRFSCTNSRLLVGLGDDAAVIGPYHSIMPGKRLNVHSQVLATDILVEDVHFSRRYMDLAEIGYKSVAVNASDMAAMGAECVYALGNLGVPRDAGSEDVARLLDGVSEAMDEFGASLIGGDTVRSPQWLLSFSMIGSISSKPLSRNGARPGDLVWHSGDLGLSQLGFHQLQGDLAHVSEQARLAHVRPKPQLALGQWLSRHELASACLDLSDSLSKCLLQLAEASGVGLRINLQDYPYHPQLREFSWQLADKHPGNGSGSDDPAGVLAFKVPGAMFPDGQPQTYAGLSDFLLAASEDYQLLFTAPESATARLLADAPVPLQKLGRVLTAVEGLSYVDQAGVSHNLQRSGYEH